MMMKLIPDLDPQARNCLFDDETSDLIIHKKYTQSNCFFECSLAYAQGKILNAQFSSNCQCIKNGKIRPSLKSNLNGSGQWRS